MQKLLQITLKDQTQISFESAVKTTTDTFIKVHEFQEEEITLLLNIQHPQINSLLELSNVASFVLLYFDDTNVFSGASYSLNGFKNSFGISIQAKKLLVLPFPIAFKLEDVISLTLIS
jgi:hypothetical protein